MSLVFVDLHLSLIYIDTTHTSQGFYIYVQTSNGITWDDATFELQQLLQPSSSGCELEFWHHLENQQFLSVHLIEGDDIVDVWEEDHDHGDQWTRVTIPLGRISRPWRLQFLAEKSYENGSIAVDDIRLVGCQFPPVRPTCNANQFRCYRNACIPLDRVCDLTYVPLL